MTKISACKRNIYSTVNVGLLGCHTVWNTVPPLPGLNNEVVCSSETLVPTYNSTWHHNPGDQNQHFHCCENLKSHTMCYSIFKTLQWTLQRHPSAFNSCAADRHSQLWNLFVQHQRSTTEPYPMLALPNSFLCNILC
jgi:hypothetical protein